MIPLFTVILLLVPFLSNGVKVTSLDSGWTFQDLSSSCPSASKPAPVTLPHDFSIESFACNRSTDPRRTIYAREFPNWSFSFTNGTSPGLWKRVTLPHTFPASAKSAMGYYKITFPTPEWAKSSSKQLEEYYGYSAAVALGFISSGDVTYLNGVQIGTTGAMENDSGCKDRLTYRRYEFDVSLLNQHQDSQKYLNTLLIQVYNQNADPLKFPGGMFDVGYDDGRFGAFDPGNSPGHGAVGYLRGGTVIYHREFDKSSLDFTKNSYAIQFDGVYQNATVLWNGVEIAYHPYGYTSFIVDLPSPPHSPSSSSQQNTDTLSVIARSIGLNSRWYAGAGIYRHVHLLTAAKSVPSIAPWSLRVVTPMNSIIFNQEEEQDQGREEGYDMKLADANVHVNVTIKLPHNTDTSTSTVSHTSEKTGRNIKESPEYQVLFKISGPDCSPEKYRYASKQFQRSFPLSQCLGAPSIHKEMVVSLPAHKGTHTEIGGDDGNVVSAVFALKNMSLWGPTSPFLYTVSASVIKTTTVNTPINKNGEKERRLLSSMTVLDTSSSEFGVRHLDFSVKSGFLLNGEPTLLYGGCVHHSNGILGSKAIESADWRRVETLKRDGGYNAIRTSHNPVSPGFIRAANRLGVMLMEEAFDTFAQGKNPQDYHLFFKDWHRRDVIAMINRDFNAPAIIMWSIGNEIPSRDNDEGKMYSKELAALVHSLDPPTGNGRVSTSAVPGVQEADDDFLAPLDVSGYNYAEDRYGPDHIRIPSRIMVGTESFPMHSYNVWNTIKANSPWVLGDFIWTAIDYYGETAIGSNGVYYPRDMAACQGGTWCAVPWSWHISFCGDFDVIGMAKPQSMVRENYWLLQ
eukprot:g3532.t1